MEWFVTKVLGLFNAGHAREQAAHVSDRFGEAGQPVVFLLFVLELRLAGVVDLHQRGNDGPKIEPTVTYDHRFGIFHAATGRQRIPQMHLIQTFAALANGFGGVFTGTETVAHIEAKADATVIGLHRLPNIEAGREFFSRAMIVDGDFEIVFFDKFINQWQRVGAL